MGSNFSISTVSPRMSSPETQDKLYRERLNKDGGSVGLDFRKYSFSQRTVNEWNNLSADCVRSSSVKMFKSRIDNFLVRAAYT